MPLSILLVQRLSVIDIYVILISKEGNNPIKILYFLQPVLCIANIDVSSDK
jgi:hypothetical protein